MCAPSLPKRMKRDDSSPPRVQGLPHGLMDSGLHAHPDTFRTDFDLSGGRVRHHQGRLNSGLTDCYDIREQMRSPRSHGSSSPLSSASSSASSASSMPTSPSTNAPSPSQRRGTTAATGQLAFDAESEHAGMDIVFGQFGHVAAVSGTSSSSSQSPLVRALNAAPRQGYEDHRPQRSNDIRSNHRSSRQQQQRCSHQGRHQHSLLAHSESERVPHECGYDAPHESPTSQSPLTSSSAPSPSSKAVSAPGSPSVVQKKKKKQASAVEMAFNAFNAQVDAWAKKGEMEKAQRIVDEHMIARGIKPNAVTFSTLVDGWVKKGSWWYCSLIVRAAPATIGVGRLLATRCWLTMIPVLAHVC